MEPRADWFATSGARELKEKSPLDYREYLRRSEEPASTELEEDLRQIELDLPRTGESVRLFLLTEEERKTLPVEEDDELPSRMMERFLPVLRNILAAYSVRNPRVGYVQGHADVLCFLLGNVNDKRDEEEAFWVYASVIERVFPEDFFARAPKLHGFQVDCKLYHELVVSKLMPHYPILAKVDLPLVTTLLSCKWFVALWVGELPLPLLYAVWDTMLREEDGTILHLLIALHFFRLAIDKIQLHMEMEQWDSSYIYKIILGQCQSATEIAPRTLIQQARTLYGLKDESVEDMRAALRRLPQLRKAEFTVLAKQTHFSHLEMEQLQDEFTFLRFQKKVCGRSKLRGLRQEELESILSREFSTWPIDVYERVYRLLKPDGYGNISFSSLMQFLSDASRGTPKEKAHLLFQIPNQQDREYLDQKSIKRFADLLCCLLTSRMVADADGYRAHEQRDRGDSTSYAAKSPLLRRHFQTKLLALATSDGRLQYTRWVEFAVVDSEVAQLMAWETTRRRSGGRLHLKTRSLSFWSLTPIQPALSRASSDSRLHRQPQTTVKRLSKASERGDDESPEQTASDQQNVEANNFGADAAPFLKKPGAVPMDGPAWAGRRQVTLLSKKMNKKFKACWPPSDVEALARNPFEEHAGASSNGAPYVLWCQCTVS